MGPCVTAFGASAPSSATAPDAPRLDDQRFGRNSASLSDATVKGTSSRRRACSSVIESHFRWDESKTRNKVTEYEGGAELVEVVEIILETGRSQASSSFWPEGGMRSESEDEKRLR